MSKNRIILTNGNERDYLTQYDEVSNPRQIIEINQSSTLEYELERNDPKWRYFEKPGTTAECNGRVYCIIGDGPISRQRDASGTHLPVVMKEIWYKLAKKYITAYNFDIDKSEKFDHVDQHMVVLWGSSNDPLYINGARVTNNPYAVGTAQYLFYCILYGSGWTLDSRYANYWPNGKFDLETDKKSVLDNLKLLQEFFGGMFFWDSKNKTVALVDEEKYQPYEGFEIRYRKNLVGVKKTEDHDITTRLYVYGNSHLNIAAVNNNREYIDNFSYTSEVMEDIIVNNDIYEQSSLLQWGKMQSARLAKPRHSYEVDIIRYTKAAKVAIPQPEIGKLAKIFDADIVGTPAMQRIRKIDQHVFVEYDCNVIAGDVIGTFERTFRDVQDGSGKADDTISGGGKVPGVDIEGNIPQLDKSNDYWNNRINEEISFVNSTIRDVEKGLQTSITKTASAIRLEAIDMENRLSASITITAKEIRSEVSAVERGLQSSITQTAGQIRSEVRDVQNGLQSSITQNSNRIALVVDGNGIRAAQIVASVNNTGSSVLISADKVQISGITTFNSWVRSGSTTIDGSKIYTGSISATQIASNAITADKIQANAVTSAKVEANAITSGKIRAGAVTAEKIQAGAITSDKIQANAITSDKISTDAVISKFTSATNITVNKITLVNGIEGNNNSIVNVGRITAKTALTFQNRTVGWVSASSARLVLGV